MRTRLADHVNPRRRAPDSTTRHENPRNRRRKCHKYCTQYSPYKVSHSCANYGHHQCGSCRFDRFHSKSHQSHETTPELDPMAFAATAYICFAVSLYDDVESNGDLQGEIVTPSGRSSAAREKIFTRCPFFKEINELSHNIDWDAEIAKITCEPCDWAFPVNLSSSKCQVCSNLEVTCWIWHIQRAESCSDTLPAFIDQVLQQWVKQQQFEHVYPSAISSTSPCYPRSPLHICALLGFLRLARVYLEMSYNPNSLAQPGGQTALHMAVAGAQLPMVGLLLAWGADLEAKTASTGRTALQIAAFRGHFEACKFLIKSGASRKVKDRGGMTAAELAQAGGHGEIAELLLETGMGSINLNKHSHTEPGVPASSVTTDPVPAKLAALSLSDPGSPTAASSTTFSSVADWSNDSFSEGLYESDSTESCGSWEQLHADSVRFSN